ncbi:hypothetical protein FHR75_003309 [Kineococcus radiotolerans]|uniref:Inorganic polyphosphate/ATP-NAD kinase n=1 Tax=Kineococcus radiotolerans TaxID=131568 RepID=A0A7W4XY05_KINRA|nr:NAD(+)/NADH kinase [Kineococcus radiotolerans]MBB2902478.1 hypothetical protein [Kineococcus radiotolerans]
MSLAPRAVLVHRRTPYADVLARHGTRGAAEFFLRTRGQTLDDLEAADERQRAALAAVAAAVPPDWRSGTLEREDLPRFLFAPEDVVVVVGQDGLVANVAKHLSGQVVLGVDPDPARHAGVLVRHRPGDVPGLLRRSVPDAAACEQRTMVRAVADDGQELHALNEVYVGHRSHQTARYVLGCPGGREEQASSGVVVGTGTGATGWLASLARARGGAVLPGPTDPALAWFVREAWPSRTTGADLVAGALPAVPGEDELTLDVLSDELVVFGDGLEEDRLLLTRGMRLRIGVSPRRLALL